MTCSGLRLCALLALAGVLGAAAAAAEDKGGRARSAGLVLDAGGTWRVFCLWRSPVVGTAAEPKEPRGYGWDRIEPSPPPPADWTAEGFDDAGWRRAAGPFYDGEGFNQPQTLAGIYLRGKFMVGDPRRVAALSLSLAFRGGAVVYLNGREVARAFLPAGELMAETLAEDYPPAAYNKPDGTTRLDARDLSDKAIRQHTLKLRTRRIEIRIDPSGLRAGRNVLGVLLRRSAFLAGPEHSSKWATCGLCGLSLVADPPGSAVPNFAAPDGLQVWNADPLDSIGPELSYGDPTEPLRPIRLVAPRNGVCSGQVVVSSSRPLGNISASIGELTGPGGARLPASAVRIRYAARKTEQMPEAAPYFDALLDRPLADGNVQPVWVTVRSAADSSPGVYEGTLKLDLGAAGSPVAVGVRLTVCGWKIPDPKDWVTWVSLWNSPESVARQYGVELWSDRHLKLLGPSLSLMGQVGNDTLYVTAIRDTLHSQRESIIVFRRAGGGLVPDFTCLDKYLDLYREHVGEPKGLIVYLWEHRMGDPRRGPDGELPVVVLGADGRREPGTCPMFGEPGSEETWRKVIDGVKARVAQRGWSEKCIWLGVGHDRRPSPETLAFFQRIAPGMRWAMFTHGRGDPRPKDGQLVVAGSMNVAYVEQPGVARVDYRRPQGGWDRRLNDVVLAGTYRACVKEYSWMRQYRSLAEGTVGGDMAGFGRLGLDYWPVPLGGADDRRGLVWNYGGWLNLYRNNPRAVLSPGPEGAVATTRYEMLREGIQECEARCFIEKKLAADKLPKDLADRCRQLLRDRIIQRTVSGDRDWRLGPNWQDRTERLFTLAGEAGRREGQGRAGGTMIGAGDER